MITLLSFCYGIFISLLIYIFTFLSVRRLLGKRSVPIYILMGKYLIYWKLLSFGFKHLLISNIIIGFIVGIYLSLPALYFLNKKFTHTS